MASEGDPVCVPESGEQPMMTNAEAINFARRAVRVPGNLRLSIFVSIGFMGSPQAEDYCHGVVKVVTKRLPR